jgi:hypothetical protein
MQQDWSIQHRANHCAVTGEPFQDGDYFYTLLFIEKGEYRREDISEAAFKARNDNIQPFSFWRSKFEVPPVAAPEPLGKQTAEDLLRRYMSEPSPELTNARFILAIMLERKKLLKEVETKRGEDGSLTRIYEHVKTGEVFVIPDPQLRLEQIAEVQTQVAGMLG